MPIIGTAIKRAIHLRKNLNFKRAKPVQYQRRTLKKLLAHAQGTAFGQKYQFEKLLDQDDPITAFQKRVPLHNYNQIFKEWWSKALHGEEDVFWPGKIKYFALSSGTSEASSKYIPVTKEMLRSITRASVKQIYSMANFDFQPETFQKQIFTLGSSTSLNKRGELYFGDMSGISASEAMPYWTRRFFKPDKEITRVTDWDTKLNKIAEHAREWDISILCGIPVWVQIMIERILEYHQADNIHQVWPNLAAYVHGGIAFEPYRKTFESFFAKPMVYVETYMASEGFFAFRSRPDAAGMKLILNNGIFYEFTPFTDKNFNADSTLKPDAETFDISEVEEGVDYAILLSNNSGAWRYLIGDTVRFTNAQEKEIIVTGRTKHYLSICGEHLSVDNMNKAINMAADEMDITILEFTVQGKPYENLFAHQWYIGIKDGDADPARLREVLDQKLKEVNDDYATERMNVLKEIFVDVVPHRFFIQWLKIQGKEGDQAKFPKVMKKDLFRDWEKFVAAEKSKIG